jgi:pimeloyl-ACP methyl ester carboxylesterase
MIFYLKKIYYSIFKKNYNSTKTLINQYYTGKKKTVLSFSSIGGGIRHIQDEEFFNLTKKYNVFFIRDITRSWFNDVDVELIKKNIMKKSCYVIGHSMGAFNAIIFSSLYKKVKKVVAFSPQFSIHPQITKDTTFRNHAARIKEWRYPKLKFTKNTNYLLIFGDDVKEKYHASLMPKRKNIKVIFIKNCDHSTAKKLKMQNKLYKLINNFFK